MQSQPLRRVRRSLALGVALAAALAVVGPLAQAGAAGSDTESFATLRVTAETVQVKAKGEDKFKKAKDGAELHAGDTVRTDANGKAEIEYGDDAYTRLDSDTTFKIDKLTDDEGNRQVEGTLESGKTWNRTAALTESESFEQTGADATAAVEGTAFAVDCSDTEHCNFTVLDHLVRLTGNEEGVVKLLSPLDECDSASGILCADITQISANDMPDWIFENFLLDIALGYEFSFGGTVVIQDGSVFFVPDAPNETPPPPPAPAVDDPPVNVTSLGGDPSPGATLGPNNAVVSQDERADVTFVLQVADASGGLFWIEFTDLPPAAFGQILDGNLAAVVLGGQYDPGTVFTFDPVEIEPVCDDVGEDGLDFSDCFSVGNPEYPFPAGSPYPSIVTPGPVPGSVQWSSSLTFKAVNDQGGESEEVTVTLTAVDDICTTGTEGTREAEAVVCPNV